MLLKHALKNAGVPIITVIGIGVALLIGGVVITETVFNIPGVGRLVVDAISKRDYPIIQGVILLFSLVYVVWNSIGNVRCLSQQCGVQRAAWRDGDRHDYGWQRRHEWHVQYCAYFRTDCRCHNHAYVERYFRRGDHYSVGNIYLNRLGYATAHTCRRS